MPKIDKPKTQEDSAVLEIDEKEFIRYMIDEIHARLQIIEDALTGEVTEVPISELLSITQPPIEGVKYNVPLVEAQASESDESKVDKVPAKNKLVENEAESPVTVSSEGTQQQSDNKAVEVAPTYAEDVVFDEDPFAEKYMSVAIENAKDSIEDTESVREYLNWYISVAPPKAKATKVIRSLVEAGDYKQAFLHLVALYVDNEGRLVSMGEEIPIVRNDSVYLCGSEPIMVPIPEKVELTGKVLDLEQMAIRKAKVSETKQVGKLAGEACFFPAAQMTFAPLTSTVLLEIKTN